MTPTNNKDAAQQARDNLINQAGEVVLDKIGKTQGSTLAILVLIIGLAWFWLDTQFERLDNQLQQVNTDVVSMQLDLALLSVGSDDRWTAAMQRQYNKDLGELNGGMKTPDIDGIRESYGEYYSRIFEALRAKAD